MVMCRLAQLITIVSLAICGCQHETPQDSQPTDPKPNNTPGIEADASDNEANSIVGMWNWEGNYLDVYHYVFRDDGTASKYVIRKSQEDGRWQIGQDGKLYVTLRDGKEKRASQRSALIPPQRLTAFLGRGAAWPSALPAEPGCLGGAEVGGANGRVVPLRPG